MSYFHILLLWYAFLLLIGPIGAIVRILMGYKFVERKIKETDGE